MNTYTDDPSDRLRNKVCSVERKYSEGFLLRASDGKKFSVVCNVNVTDVEILILFDIFLFSTEVDESAVIAGLSVAVKLFVI